MLWLPPTSSRRLLLDYVTRKISCIHRLETYLKPLIWLSFFLCYLKLKFCIQNVILLNSRAEAVFHFLITSETQVPWFCLRNWDGDREGGIKGQNLVYFGVIWLTRFIMSLFVFWHSYLISNKNFTNYTNVVNTW